MRLSELIRAAQEALEKHGDLGVFLEVPKDELEAVKAEAFQCVSLTSKPWFFFITAEGVAASEALDSSARDVDH